METINDYAKQSLGSENSYAVHSTKEDASLLVKMPRALARKDWDIKGDEFIGYDVWHCHEATFLTSNGLPITGTLKIVYPSSSEFMVESKSMKLYLNTFDMTKMSFSSKINSIDEYEECVKISLSNLLGVEVMVRFFEESARTVNWTLEYHRLESQITDIEGVVFEDYTTKENHLKFLPSGREKNYSMSVYTDILRSRCRHTKQKDTGSIYIRIDSKNGFVEYESLLKQIVSLREQNEFHEFCCEKLFNDIMKVEGVTDCSVVMLYSRRGSLDINPIRVSREELLPKGLCLVNVLTEKTRFQ